MLDILKVNKTKTRLKSLVFSYLFATEYIRDNVIEVD